MNGNYYNDANEKSDGDGDITLQLRNATFI